jgi:GNAT superfamily N-acetyltransferase
LGDGWKVIGAAPQGTSAPAPAPTGASRDLGDGWKVIGAAPTPAAPSQDTGGWDLSKFKPIDGAPAPAASTPAATPGGWDLSKFKPAATQPPPRVNGPQPPAAAAAAPPATPVPAQLGPDTDTSDREPEQHPDSYYNVQPTRYGRNEKGQLVSKWDGNNWVSLFNGAKTGAPASETKLQAAPPRPDTPTERVPGMPGGIPPGVPRPSTQMEYNQFANAPIRGLTPGAPPDAPAWEGVHEPFETLPALATAYHGAKALAHEMGSTQPNPKKAAGGAAQILGGTMNAIAPVAIPAGLATAPLEAALSLATGTAAGTGATAALNKLGIAPEYSDLAGDVIGLLAGYGAAKVRLSPEQQTLVEALKGEEPAGGRARTIESLRSMVDRGGTENERTVAQSILEKRYGIKYGPEAQPEAPAPPPPPPPAPPSAETPSAPPAAQAPAPRDLGDGWTANPIEDHIAEQERAAIAERKGKGPLAQQPEVPVPAPPAQPPAVVEKPHAVTPTESPLDLGNGWTAVPAPPKREEAPPAAPPKPAAAAPSQPVPLTPEARAALKPGDRIQNTRELAPNWPADTGTGPLEVTRVLPDGTVMVKGGANGKGEQFADNPVEPWHQKQMSVLPAQPPAAAPAKPPFPPPAPAAAAPAKPETPLPAAPGIEYRWRETPDAMFAEAYRNGTPIAAATFSNGTRPGELLAQNVHVDPEFQRQGIATRLYDMAAFQYQQQSGTRPRFVSATDQTAEGKAFRQAYDARQRGSQNEPAKPATAGAPAPNSYANVPPSSLTLDPARFQFKFEGIGQKGVSDQFKNVAKWNPNLGGTVDVWYDPANGKTYPVNGHHRTELGQRLGDENVPGGIHVRYIDAPDARTARAEGALINIGEGNGTALDVAKFLRDTGTTVQQLATEHGIELHKKEGQQGAALANLTEPIFHDVVHGLLPVERAAVLGAGVPNHADQTATYTLMRQREASGQRLTNDQVAEMIRLTQRAPKITVKPGEAAQGSMFDVGEMTRSLIPEKAIVSDYVRGQLKAEKKLFGAVSTQAAADRLGEAGNVIQTGTNAAKSEAANQGISLYDKLSTSAGPIDGILDRAAQRIANGDNANDTKQDAYREVRDHLAAQLQALTGRAPASGGQPESEGQGRGSPVSAGEPNPLESRGAGSDDTGRAGQVRTGEGGPQLAQRVGERPEEPPEPPRAEAVKRTGAQLVDTLRVNRSAADLLRDAYSFAGGTRIGSFDGAAVKSADVRLLLKGLDGMAGEGHPTAGAIAAELREASAKGLRGVAVAGPEAESHEQLHFAINRLGFDPEKVLEDGPTLRATIEARSRGLASGSKDRAIREVMTRIANGEHETVKVDRATGRRMLGNFLANCTHDEAALATLKELGHADVKDTIAQARGTNDAGEALRAGEESEGPPDHRARSGSGGGAGGVGPAHGREGSDEGPELSRPPSRNLSLFGNEDHNAEAERLAAERLTGARLTAQLKSGGAVKPSKLKPAENRGLFDEEKPESGDLFGSERGSLSLKSTKTPEQIQAERDQRSAKNLREWFTGGRDPWGARVHQITARLRRDLPSHVDREGLYLMRDFRNRPGELEQWLNGTHEGYRDVPRIDIARENMEKMRPAIERALNPTPAMEKADRELTAIAEASLREGQRLGFIERHVSPDEYVTHLLQSPEDREKTPVLDTLGRAIGGKIGRNFPYNQEREFPTILDAIAHNQRPKTLDALKAFDTYGDKFATARATHMLVQQLSDSSTGVWGTPGGKQMPKGWVPLAAHSNLFKNTVAWVDPEGAPHPAEQSLLVPPKVERALRPITDPDYLARIPGWTRARNFQLFTKAAQLSLSFFHATAESVMALGNVGVRGYWKAQRADRFSPEFEEQELDLIHHGGTTSIQGNKGPQEGVGATSPLTVSSLPTAAEAIRSTHGIREVDQAAQKITAFTFENQQRRFKVTDYAVHKAAWLAQHPDAMRSERTAAFRSIAKELNAVYGGLHWENLGANKMAVNIARLLQLAPDWWWSNVLNVKYATEGGPKAALHQAASAFGARGKMPPGWEGSPAGNMARAFWLRTIIGGLAATQAASLFFSGKPSKRPTQVFLGLDKDGNEIHQNLFFRGAPGQLFNTVSNFMEYGGPEGLARTVSQSASPGLRTYNEAAQNQTFLGHEIAPKGMNPIASTVRGGIEAAKSLAPVPWSFSNAYEMLLGADADKYKKIELLTTLFAGTPPTHHKPSKPEKDSQSIWDQIVSGKVHPPAPRSAKPTDPVQQMKREQRKLLHP